LARNKTVDNRFQDLLREFEQHLRDEADLGRLKVIRRQIRKTLPFLVRAYLPAYLLQEAAGSGVSHAARGPNRSSSGNKPLSSSPGGTKLSSNVKKRAKDIKMAGRDRKPTVSRADNETQPVDGQMARLFVNAGRRRGVSREMLTDLFATKLGLSSAEIGSVRVLDNYSFVELPVALSKSAIEQISGETLNGRTLTVDHARDKKP